MTKNKGNIAGNHMPGGGEAEKAGEHHLRDHHALEELLVEPQPARRPAALQRPFTRAVVVFTVAADSLHFVEPADDLLEPLPGIVRAERLHLCH